mgnify:CR=1 FL=1
MPRKLRNRIFIVAGIGAVALIAVASVSWMALQKLQKADAAVAEINQLRGRLGALQLEFGGARGQFYDFVSKRGEDRAAKVDEALVNASASSLKLAASAADTPYAANVDRLTEIAPALQKEFVALRATGRVAGLAHIALAPVRLVLAAEKRKNHSTVPFLP